LAFQCISVPDEVSKR